MSINELFESVATEGTTATRTLAGTAKLVDTANKYVQVVFAAADNDVDSFGQMLIDSQTDMKALDELIDATVNMIPEDYEWINELGDDQVESMLKSQQSKKSRAKSKTMTLETYKTMMSAAIAEKLIRVATGKTKHSGARRAAGEIAYSEERLAELASDQEALKREIRNVQSKKSIMKAKADFDESDDRWLQLLDAETTLKGLRTTSGRVVVKEVDKTGDTLREMLAEIDVQKLKAAEAKELLESIKDVLFSDEELEAPADEEETTEQPSAEDVVNEFFQ